MKVEAVVFDFGRVVCDFDLGLFIRRAAPYSRKTAAELQELMRHSVSLAARYESGKISTEAFYREICRAAELEMGQEQFVKAYTDIFTPIPTTFDLLRRLKGRYRLALLSNTSELHYKYGIRTVDVFPLFEAVTLSFEVGAMKPDKKIYDDVLRKLALPASACVYIDDIGEYVQAGRALGFTAIQYTSPEQLMRDLGAFDVAI
ncbi:MAG TPA: HAD family phosphatase [Bacteroidota bacterium]|nr:HAD family phosphatase [Bacteroidota bacterium]